MRASHAGSLCQAPTVRRGPGAWLPIEFITIDQPTCFGPHYYSLIFNAYARHMLRVAALLLALAVGFDYAMLNGKYTNAARQVTVAIFHSFAH